MDIQSLERFLAYYDRIYARTRRVLTCIPPDRIEWTHRAGAFTLGDVVRHVAGLERWMFAENVAGRASSYPGHDRTLADGYDAVLAYADRLHEETAAVLRTCGKAVLERTVTTPAGAEMAAWKWLRAMIEHHVHHRGQLYLMLGILEAPTPPLYGLTAEEVHARSQVREEW